MPEQEERLSNLIADFIAPRLVPKIEMTTVGGKTLLVVGVFLSGIRPHFIKGEGRENGVYIRLGSTNRQADAQLVAELQRGVAGVSFDALPMDALPMPELTLDDLDDLDNLDDLDVKAIKRILRKSVTWMNRCCKSAHPGKGSACV